MKINKFLAMTAVVIAFVAGVSAGLSMRGYNPCDNHPIAQLNQQLVLRGQKIGNSDAEFFGLDPTQSNFSAGLIFGRRKGNEQSDQRRYHALPGVWIDDTEFNLTFKVIAYCIERNSDQSADGMARFNDWILIEFSQQPAM